MSIVGIVAEYNPLHNGHLYHIKMSKEISDAELVVCAMSGNFVQRGMPAVIPKHLRAKHAVMCGADLVVEIPTVYSVASSDIFAKAGINILEALNCNYISFGSEEGNIDRLKAVSSKLSDERLDSYIKSFYSEGISYPKAREIAYNEMFNENCDLLNKPNNILALEYLKNINKAKPITVKRLGASYNDEQIKDLEDFQSATAIRKSLYEKSDISSYVPRNTLNDLIGESTVDIDKLFSLLKYRIITGEADEFESCPSGGEGLGNKLKNEINKANTLEELIDIIKSKRYTRTRITRLLIQVLLLMNREMISYDDMGYIKPLAFNKRGAKILNGSDLMVISNINKVEMPADKYKYSLDKEILATDIYNMISGRNLYKNSEKVLKPQFIEL